MAGSISAKQITAAAKDSAAKVLQAHLREHPKFDIGFSPPPWWWIGVIIQHRADLTLGEAQKISTELHHAVASEVPSIKGGKPGAVLIDGHLTVGFVPPIDVRVIHE
jgi:hypothetical protein